MQTEHNINIEISDGLPKNVPAMGSFIVELVNFVIFFGTKENLTSMGGPHKFI